MKTKFLFAGLALALTLGALAPTSAMADHGSSGYYSTRVVGYDHCGRPIYQRVWVPSCNPRPSYPSYSSGHQHGSSSGGYIHAPGIDIHFGGSGSSHHRNHGR